MSNQKAGQFTAHDNQKVRVIIEWQQTTLFAQEYATAMRKIWPLACKTYTPVEMQFLQTYPEVVGTESYFKSFEPLFKEGLAHVDWAKAEETQQAVLKSHFIFDASSWGPEVYQLYAKDVCYVVTIKDKKTSSPLGFITGMIRENYPKGDIKIMSFAVDQAHQKQGLGKLLMSSMLKIAPAINRIFLGTRITNDTALKAYYAWGFTKDEKPTLEHAFNLNHWIFLEYKTRQSDILQKIAAELKPV